MPWDSLIPSGRVLRRRRRIRSHWSIGWMISARRFSGDSCRRRGISRRRHEDLRGAHREPLLERPPRVPGACRVPAAPPCDRRSRRCRACWAWHLRGRSLPRYRTVGRRAPRSEFRGVARSSNPRQGRRFGPAQDRPLGQPLVPCREICRPPGCNRRQHARRLRLPRLALPSPSAAVPCTNGSRSSRNRPSRQIRRDNRAPIRLP